MLPDFPGGPIDRNPTVNAEDRGSTPGQAIFHMSQSNSVQAPQLQSPRSRAHEAQLLSPSAATTGLMRLEPVLPSKRNHRNEELECCKQAHPPLAAARESLHCNGDPVQPQIEQ